MRSGSTSDLPTSCPSARRNVNAMPPPISSASTLREQAARPARSCRRPWRRRAPRPADAAGASRIRPSASSSRRISRPAAAGLQVARDRGDRGVRAVGGGEGVVDVARRPARPAAARSRRRWPLPRDGSAGSPAGASRRASAHAPGSPSRPTQSGASGIGRSSSAASRAATGFSEYFGSGPPLGRPRCEARTTEAPCSSA